MISHSLFTKNLTAKRKLKHFLINISQLQLRVSQNKKILNKKKYLILVDVNKDSANFYAVARGREAGVFDNYNIVRKHVFFIIYFCKLFNFFLFRLPIFQTHCIKNFQH